MDIISEKARNCLPYDLETRLHSVRRGVESGWSIRKAIAYYKVKRTTFWRWRKRYDGTEESLMDKSRRPHSEHPRKTPIEAVSKISNYRRRNPGDSSIDIWVKTVKSGWAMCYSTCLRILKRLDGYEPYKTNPKRRRDGKYHTPDYPGDKWQVDVKYVPTECKAPGLEGRFYQYTYLDEASRKRFLYFANEHSMYETVNGLREAIAFFGYAPKTIQTDNGFEFSDRASAKGKGFSSISRDGPNFLERFCLEEGISHKFIRPRTPEHNGKVERSHRIDQEKFYRTLSFYSLEDLRGQGKRWMGKYNRTPRNVLDLKSPDEIEIEKLGKLMHDTGEVRCLKLLKCFTSFDS